MGLLLARNGLGLTALLVAYRAGGDERAVSVAPLVLTGVIALCGAALVVGLLTPLAAGLLAMIVVVDAIAPTMALPLTGAAGVHLVTDAAVMALLGPGAYSFDARRFGRREIVLSREPRL